MTAFGSATAGALRPDFAERVCGWKAGDTVVRVPANVEKLPDFAFADMAGLREVRFEGARLRAVGEYAFLGCGGLTEIRLPESVTELGEGCFRECTALRSMVIPPGVGKLPRFAFEWDEELETVALPDGLEDIGSHAFAYCTALKEIRIPARVRHIGSNAFTRCTGLREVTVPDSITELESYAFSDCTGLERVTLPANNHMLGELLLSGCHGLRELTILSPEPPTFDCDSPLIEPGEAWLYGQVTLRVLPEARARYAATPQFRRFQRIILCAPGSTRTDIASRCFPVPSPGIISCLTYGQRFAMFGQQFDIYMEK